MDASVLKARAKEFAKAQATIDYMNSEIVAAKDAAEKARAAMVEALREDNTVKAIQVSAERVLLVKRSGDDIDLEVVACL